MYRLALNPTTGRHFTPVGGDTGVEQEVIEILPLESPMPAPAEPVPAEPVPAGA